MKGFYPNILRQAYSLTKDHQIFWVAGLFLVWPNLFRAVLWIALVLMVMSTGQSYPSQTDQVQEGNVWVGLISVVALCLFVTYYYRSRAVVNVATKHLRTKTTIDNSHVYQEADPYTWELMKYGFINSIGLTLLIAFLSGPVMYLNAHNFTNRAFILGLFAFGVFLPIFTVLYYSMIFVPMFVTLHQMTASNAFRASFDLVKRNWVYLVFLSILLVIIEIIAVFGVLIALYFVASGFVILAQIFYDVEGSGAINVIQVLVATLGFVVFFTSQSIVAVFQRIAWTVMFFEIVRPIKIEERVEAVTAPEVIS